MEGKCYSLASSEVSADSLTRISGSALSLAADRRLLRPPFPLSALFPAIIRLGLFIIVFRLSVRFACWERSPVFMVPRYAVFFFFSGHALLKNKQYVYDVHTAPENQKPRPSPQSTFSTTHFSGENFVLIIKSWVEQINKVRADYRVESTLRWIYSTPYRSRYTYTYAYMILCVCKSTPNCIRNTFNLLMLINYKQRAQVGIVFNILCTHIFYAISIWYIYVLLCNILTRKQSNLSCKSSILLQTWRHVHFIQNQLHLTVFTVLLPHLTMRLDTVLMRICNICVGSLGMYTVPLECVFHLHADCLQLVRLWQLKSS